MNEATKRMRPIHPGEILREEFLILLNLSANPRPSESWRGRGGDWRP